MANQNRTVVLDDVSKAIIEQLQADGRKSYSDIGRAVELSEAAVRQRVQKLTESGVMQIVAVTDPLQLGFFRQAMIGPDGSVCGGEDRASRSNRVMPRSGPATASVSSSCRSSGQGNSGSKSRCARPITKGC